MRRSGPPKVESFRDAEPPKSAPSIETARGVWELVSVGLPSVPLPSGAVPREITHVASSVLRYAIGGSRVSVMDTAKRALTVALDVFICAGRDGKPVHINHIFDALARRWSPLFRVANGKNVSEKTPATLTRARTEILDAGVDLTKIWTAVCDGVEGLYTVSLNGGPEHARGRRVDLIEGTILDKVETLIVADPTHKRPSGRNRVLCAETRTPARHIAAETIAEVEYDVMGIGERTEPVLQLLEGARLFVDAERVRKDAETLRAAVDGHAWPKMWASWRKENALPKEPHAEAAMLESWIGRRASRAKAVRGQAGSAGRAGQIPGRG